MWMIAYYATIKHGSPISYELKQVRKRSFCEILYIAYHQNLQLIAIDTVEGIDRIIDNLTFGGWLALVRSQSNFL